MTESTRTRLDPLEYLERSDKWYLGGGHAALFAPPFPRFLDSLGFWDEAHFVDVRLDRLFTILILGEDERPIALRRESRRWTPDALTQTYSSDSGLRVREDKIVNEHDTLASRLTVHNESKKTRTLHVVLWSLQNRAPYSPGRDCVSAEEIVRVGDYVAFDHTVSYGDAAYADRPAENAGWGERSAVKRLGDPARHVLHVALGADRPPVSHCAALAECADSAPLWDTSVLPEKFRDGRLPDVFETGAAASNSRASSRPGQVHICLHYMVEIPPGESRTIQLGAAVALDRGLALLHLQNDLQSDVAAASRASWHRYFASVPYFECSDAWLQKYYWYRWYGLRLLTVDLGGHRVEGEDGVRFAHPCVLEGIDGFRSHISYSAQCHAREACWMHDPRLAIGCIEGLFAAQERNGYLPGHLYLWRPTRGFYHADWGACALQLYHVTGDLEVVERLYPGLARYAEYFERDRDREDMRLYDVVDQGETGQEYAPRYLFADPAADDWRRIQLKGVDATVYVYRLQRALAEMARALGNNDESAVWDAKADATRDAVRARMWHADTAFFVDVDPRTGAPSPHKAAVGFYPFMCDIAGPDNLGALREHLLSPASFWTTWPVPTASLDDAMFSATAEWKGRRLSCPWNGRVWPMANSHVAEGLAHAALTLDKTLRPEAAELIYRFVRLLFFDGDPERPNCYEHYSPLTGSPSTYRGIDDYQHSWVIDLLVKYLVGVQPSGGETLTLDPLPFNVERFNAERIRYRGHSVDVRWDGSRGGEGYVVAVDGEERARRPERARLEIEL